MMIYRLYIQCCSNSWVLVTTSALRPAHLLAALEAAILCRHKSFLRAQQILMAFVCLYLKFSPSGAYRGPLVRNVLEPSNTLADHRERMPSEVNGDIRPWVPDALRGDPHRTWGLTAAPQSTHYQQQHTQSLWGGSNLERRN